MSLWQKFYSGLTTVAHPLVHGLIYWREGHGKEDPERLHERFGYAGVERPTGKLVWIHAASVGEMMSTLLLVEKLAVQLPQTNFLITTGTVTSARVLETRLPPRTIHQFIPVDVPECVERFITTWHPDCALWVESELWPNLLAALRRHKIPAALLNARMSDQSRRNWRWAQSWVTEMFSSFQLCLSQTTEGQDGLRDLGAKNVLYVGNLKLGALPLPDDEFSRAQLRASIGTRPLWLFASSHQGEEDIAIAAHQLLCQEFPNLLSILVPRHPARAEKIMALLAQNNITTAQRSLGQRPTGEHNFYLADSLGELGVFYRLCPIVVVGGSFVPVGGHNPIEPALLSCAVGFGALMPNFAEVAATMIDQHAATQLTDAAAIADFVGTMLRNPAMREQQANTAHAYAAQQSVVHDRALIALAPLIEQAGLL
jgi:3-deoxy-D-manno-octulosonic-acid transferase